MSRNGFQAPKKLGLGKENLFHVVLPVATCVKCKLGRVMATTKTECIRLPHGAVATCQVDVLLKRVVRMNLTDWLCRVYRKQWNQEALRAQYMDLVGTNFQNTDDAKKTRVQQAVFLYLKGGIPDPRTLAKIVLLCFQQVELPRLENEIRWVCARFGAVLAVDASSAPLQEARQYRSRKRPKDDHARLDPGPGAAIRALGLFDVPLCPVVYTRSEGRPAVAEMVGFLVSQATMVDSDALPLGWVQDNTEKMWPTMVHVVTKLLHSHERDGRIKVKNETKEVSGFFVGVDPKHVEWRLQDALNSRSADFLHAAWALRTLFARVFNVHMVEQDAPQDGSSSASNGELQGRWEETWEAWILNREVQISVKIGQRAAAAFRQCLNRELDGQAIFRSDGCVPPRALMSNFLSLMGCHVEQKVLWEDKATGELYLEELAAFRAWFSKAMVPWL